MYNRRYDKAFVMLQQDTNGYNLANKPAWGNVAMEIKNGKGRITLTVQELKPLPQEREYVLYVIGGDKGTAEGVRCGIVPIDSYGRGELRWEFDPDNIGGSNRAAEELHTVAILVEGRENYGLIAPLAGSFHEPVNWKKRFTVYKKKPKEPEKAIVVEKPKELEKAVEIEEVKEMEKAIEVEEPKELEKAIEVEEVKELEKAVEVEEVKELEKAIVVEEVKELEKAVEVEEPKELEKAVEVEEPKETEKACETESRESNFHKTFKDMMARFYKELAELENMGVITPEDRVRIDAAGMPKNTIQRGIEGQMSYICSQNTPITPFEGDERQWRCISIEELAVLPVAYLSFMRQPFLLLPYRRYKHFIFGWDESGSCYLGVPDRYQQENARLAQELGFNTFLPCDSGEVKPDSMGYWLHEIGK